VSWLLCHFVGAKQNILSKVYGLCDYDAILEDHETLMIGNPE
jgi:hypothetical protein